MMEENHLYSKSIYLNDNLIEKMTFTAKSRRCLAKYLGSMALPCCHATLTLSPPFGAFRSTRYEWLGAGGTCGGGDCPSVLLSLHSLPPGFFFSSFYFTLSLLLLACALLPSLTLSAIGNV